MSKEKGITLIALIITVIVMLILVGVGVYFGTEALQTARLEDIKTDMITIKTKAKIIADEYKYEEDVEDKMGQLVQDSALLTKLGITGDAYMWNRQTLDKHGLNTIKENKYVVKYDFDNPNNTEVYFVDGISGLYSLTNISKIYDLRKTAVVVIADERRNS